MLRRLLLILVLAAAPAPAFAWGAQGHAVVAAIARSYLRPETKAKIDAMLAADTDPLAPHDMLSQAAWADAYRQSHKETTEWHFVDIELDKPDLRAACFSLPRPLTPASSGPEKDCIVGRLTAFEKELADPKTAPVERLLALKFVLHFVGDIHQPLHTSDHQDRGGNCVQLSLGGPRTVNLHTYWDSTVLRQIAPSTGEIASVLRSRISARQRTVWSRGTPSAWAMESYEVAKARVYSFPTAAGCDDTRGAVPLPAGYETQARKAIEIQLQKAGVRLAMVLEKALG